MFFTTNPTTVTLSTVVSKLDELIEAVGNDIDNYWPGIVIASIGILGNIIATIMSNIDNSKERKQRLVVFKKERIYENYSKSFSLIEDISILNHDYYLFYYNLIQFLDTKNCSDSYYTECCDFHDDYVKKIPRLVKKLETALSLSLVEVNNLRDTISKRYQGLIGLFALTTRSELEQKLNDETHKKYLSKLQKQNDLFKMSIQIIKSDINSHYSKFINEFKV